MSRAASEVSTLYRAYAGVPSRCAPNLARGMIKCIRNAIEPRTPCNTFSGQCARGFVSPPWIRSHIGAFARSSQHCAEPSPSAQLDHTPKGKDEDLPIADLVSSVKESELLSRAGNHGEASTSWLCEALSALVQPDSKFFPWKWGAKIHYRQAGTGGRKILLVHGFGVGAHQYSSLLPLLADSHEVWALDLLGQGLSWPSRDALAEEELRLSIDTWTNLLEDFIREVIREPVYVVGNSLGGYLAAQLAATRQHLCRGVVYLNATPFWAFMPRPETQELTGRLLRRLVQYDGVMPAPEGLKRVIRSLWWDKFTTEDSVRSILQQVYRLRPADEKLLSNILAATQHELAVDAIASIIFSPGTVQRFGDLAAAAQCPSCLIYGRHDPWVRPVWGQRLKRLVPHATYLEIPAGHCPHDEAPAAVHWCLQEWIASIEEDRPLCLDVGQEVIVDSEEGEPIAVRHVSGDGQTIFERCVEIFHRKDGRHFRTAS